MKTVHRFKFNAEAVGGIQEIQLPKGARVLCVGFTGTSLCLWAEVNVPEDKTKQAETEPRNFELFKTGEEMPPSPGARREYVGSIITGPLHAHIYEWIAVEETKAVDAPAQQAAQ